MASRNLQLTGLFAAAAVAVAAPRTVHGQSSPDRAPPVAFELSAGTWFPLQIGIEGTVEAPFGLTGHLGIGWMPHFYRDMINDAAVSFGWYDDTDAEVVAAALEDATLITPSIGWRVPALGGLEIYAGYVLTLLGGTITREEAEDISDENLRQYGVEDVPLSGTAHGFQIGVAYEAALHRHLALRLSLAYFQIFDAGTSIDVSVDGAAAQRVAARVDAAVDDYVSDLLTTYVKAPLLGFSLVWRF